MIIEGMVYSLEENRCTKRNTISIQISKETFDNLIAVSHLGDEYEICGKTVVIYDEETELFNAEQYCKILEEKVEKLEKTLEDLGYKPIYLSR